jgi:two-component system chemotaxis response regulator CheV
MEKSDEELYAGLEVTPLTKGKHVLVADDSTVARKQLTKALERMGMTSEEVTTGKEAWERMNIIAEQAERRGCDFQNLVQIVLTDIEMPEMDGFTFTKLVRADPRFGKIPILMHSSLSGTCNVEHGKTVGVTDYVTKFDAKNLREVLLRVLEAEAQKAVPV